MNHFEANSCLVLVRQRTILHAVYRQEKTASQCLFLCPVDWTKAGRERMQPPIASLKTQQCCAQAGHTANVRSKMSSARMYTYKFNGVAILTFYTVTDLSIGDLGIVEGGKYCVSTTSLVTMQNTTLNKEVIIFL
ncbi:unnamed protein product [Spodoptera exigua]|nr:unnamed protein product [Spodoptera exigua]